MEAAIERATKPASDEPEKSRRPFGFQPGKSGNPSGNRYLKDQAAALFDAMNADLGPLTKTDEILLKQACLMLAKSSRISGRDRANIDVAVRLHSEARRTITALRRRLAASSAPAKPVSLDEHLAEAAAAAESRTTDHRNGIAGPSDDEAT